MRQEAITSSLVRRLGQRSNWSAVILLGGTFFLLRMLGGGPSTPLDLLVPVLLLASHLALAPIPWQWAGRVHPGVGRGFLQALLFNVAWVAAVLWLMHTFFLDQPGFHGPGRPPAPHMPPPGPRHPLLALGLINVAFATAFGWFYTEKEAAETRAQRMAFLLRQSQSRALQGQLKPHVLFNALNSLSELVYEDPLAAEEVLARLADLYRMLMAHSEAEFVLLGEERRLVEAYLAMEQMRLGDRLVVLWDWPSWCDELALPPLFLQPLVENAIKHGVSPSEQGGVVQISMGAEGGTHYLRVANTGHGLKEGAGLGLRNLRSRLELWPEVRGTFDLATDGGWTVATLRWTPRKVT